MADGRSRRRWWQSLVGREGIVSHPDLRLPVAFDPGPVGDQHPATGSAKGAMLLIKTLDNGAHISLSEHTGQWFVSAHIEVGGDGVLVGGTEHRATPDEAVSAYLTYLCSIGLDHYLVTKFDGQRRHWRWNGAAFREDYVRA